MPFVQFGLWLESPPIIVLPGAPGNCTVLFVLPDTPAKWQPQVVTLKTFLDPDSDWVTGWFPLPFPTNPHTGFFF